MTKIASIHDEDRPRIIRLGYATEEIIIDSAGKLFMQYGFKSITMDDVAKDLYSNKEVK